MTGQISSAQAREVVLDKPETKPEELQGSMSSHDLLKEDLKPVEPVAEEAPEAEVKVEFGSSVPIRLPEETKQDHPNFRSMRQKAEAAEREARDKEEIIQRLLRQQSSYAPGATAGQAESVPDDSLLERRHLTPLEKRLERLERENEQLKQITASDFSKRDLRAKYPDYDQVMSEDNLKDLEYMEPAIARALRTSSDFEGASKLAYMAIKHHGLHQPSDQSAKYDPQQIERDKKRIAENMAKPKPVSAIGKSSTALGELSPYHREQTKEHKDMVWARMQKKMRTKKSF